MNMSPSGKEPVSETPFMDEVLEEASRDTPYEGSHGGNFVNPAYYVEDGALVKQATESGRKGRLVMGFLE